MMKQVTLKRKLYIRMFDFEVACGVKVRKYGTDEVELMWKNDRGHTCIQKLKTYIAELVWSRAVRIRDREKIRVLKSKNDGI